MRKLSLFILIISGLLVMGCANTGRYNTQKGAAMGAGLGALAGQAIGHNTEATVIGTGVGALLGTIVGNSMDQQADEYRSENETYREEYDQHHGNRRYGEYSQQSPTPRRAPPPGRWIVVPGHWEGRRWVPAHEVWRPIDPR